MAKKFYAVRKGLKPGIYNTWDEAKVLVNGFKGAEYKSFKTIEEANEFMDGVNSINAIPKKQVCVSSINNDINSRINNLSSNSVIAFVDGSYVEDSNYKLYSYGAIIKTSDFEQTFYRCYENGEYVESRNVAGEIEGVKKAISWSIENNMESILVCYDYAGIEKWATGSWNANKPISKDYVAYIDSIKSVIKLEFMHVKAHTGIEYNEKADRLAAFAIDEYRKANN